MSEYYLQHHGVLGMKWGVRRYQNKDGSYKSGSDGRYNDTVPTSQQGKPLTRSQSKVSAKQQQKNAKQVRVARSGHEAMIDFEKSELKDFENYKKEIQRDKYLEDHEKRKALADADYDMKIIRANIEKSEMMLKRIDSIDVSSSTKKIVKETLKNLDQEYKLDYRQRNEKRKVTDM